jgi:hypothetical protein
MRSIKQVKYVNEVQLKHVNQVVLKYVNQVVQVKYVNEL